MHTVPAKRPPTDAQLFHRDGTLQSQCVCRHTAPRHRRYSTVKTISPHVPGSLFTAENSATMLWSLLNRLTPKTQVVFSTTMASLFPIKKLMDVALTTQSQGQLQ